MDEIEWPINARPRVEAVVQALLVDRHFEPVHRALTHALHLHTYEGVIRIGEQAHDLSDGVLTLSPAQVASSYDLPRRGMHWCIHFQVSQPDAACPTLHIPLVQSLGKRAPEAAARFTHLIRLRSMLNSAPALDKPLIDAAMSIACQELLVWTGMVGRTKTSTAGHAHYPAVTDLIEFIDLNLHRPLRLSELVARAGLSWNYLARLFRKQTGLTMPSYLLSRRIALANLLLTTTDLPVKQIAIRAGLPNAQHFNKQFRRLTGNSPTECRTAAGRRLAANSSPSARGRG